MGRDTGRKEILPPRLVRLLALAWCPGVRARAMLPLATAPALALPPSVAATEPALDLMRSRPFSLSDHAPRRFSFLQVALTWAAAPGAAPPPASCAMRAVGLDFILLS